MLNLIWPSSVSGLCFYCDVSSVVFKVGLCQWASPGSHVFKYLGVEIVVLGISASLAPCPVSLYLSKMRHRIRRGLTGPKIFHLLNFRESLACQY